MSPDQKELFQRLLQAQSPPSTPGAPLTFAQEACVQAPDDRIHPLTLAYHLYGVVDPDLLAQAWIHLMERHSGLCSRRLGADQQAPGPAPALLLCQLSQSELPDWIDSIRAEPFVLEQGPMLRAHLVTLAARHFVLVVVIHAWVADCFSARLLLGEFSQFYQSLLFQQPLQLPTLAGDLAALARAQRGADLQSQRDYWQVQATAWPAAPAPGPAQQPKRLDIEIDSQQLEAIRKRAAALNATPFLLLVAALMRAQQQANLANLPLGVIVSCRSWPDSEQMVAPLANVLPVAPPAQPDLDPDAYLGQIRHNLLGAQSHQEFPVWTLFPSRATPHCMAFVMHQSRTQDQLALSGLRTQSVSIPPGLTCLPYEVAAVLTPDGLQFSLHIHADHLEQPLSQELQRLPMHLRWLLQGAPSVPLSQPGPPLANEEGIVAAMAAILRVPTSSIQPEAGFFQSGLDSMGGLALRAQLEQRLQRSIPLAWLFDYASPRLLAGHLQGPPSSPSPPTLPAPAAAPRRSPESLATVCLLLLLLLPGLGFAWRGGKEELRERRKMSNPPQLHSLRPQQLALFRRDAEAYWNDHFGLRAPLIRARAALINLTASSPSPAVIRGSQGWLFDGEIVAGKWSGLQNPPSWERAAQSLVDLRDRLARQGIPLIVAFTPEKEETYPEYLPASMREPMRFLLGHRQGMKEHLQTHTDLDVCDMQLGFIERKPLGKLFFKTDRHWTPLGAYYGFLELRTHLLKYFPDLPAVALSDFNTRHQIGSENDSLSRLAALPTPPEDQLVIEAKNPSWQAIGAPSSGALGAGSIAVHDCATVGRPVLPRALVFHNSMMKAMAPFLGEEFSRCRMLRTSLPWMRVINQERPDVVIVMLASAMQLDVPRVDGVFQRGDLVLDAFHEPDWRPLAPANRLLKNDSSCEVRLQVRCLQTGQASFTFSSPQGLVSAVRALQPGLNRLHWVLPGGLARLQLPTDSQLDRLDRAPLSPMADCLPADPRLKGLLDPPKRERGKPRPPVYVGHYRSLSCGPGLELVRTDFMDLPVSKLYYQDFFFRGSTLLQRWTYPARSLSNCPRHPALLSPLPSAGCPVCGGSLYEVGNLEWDSPDFLRLVQPMDPKDPDYAGLIQVCHSLAGSPSRIELRRLQADFVAAQWEAPPSLRLLVLKKGEQGWAVHSWLNGERCLYSCPRHPQVVHPGAGQLCPFDGQPLTAEKSR